MRSIHFETVPKSLPAKNSENLVLDDPSNKLCNVNVRVCKKEMQHQHKKKAWGNNYKETRCSFLQKETSKQHQSITGWCLTPTLLLICSSFSRENGYPLLICSSLSTAQLKILTSISPFWGWYIYIYMAELHRHETVCPRRFYLLTKTGVQDTVQGWQEKRPATDCSMYIVSYRCRCRYMEREIM